MLKLNLKPGDKVRVRSREWYESKKNGLSAISISDPVIGFSCYFGDKASKFCGEEITVRENYNGFPSFSIEEDAGATEWFAGHLEPKSEVFIEKKYDNVILVNGYYAMELPKSELLNMSLKLAELAMEE